MKTNYLKIILSIIITLSITILVILFSFILREYGLHKNVFLIILACISYIVTIYIFIKSVIETHKIKKENDNINLDDKLNKTKKYQKESLDYDKVLSSMNNTINSTYKYVIIILLNTIIFQFFFALLVYKAIPVYILIGLVEFDIISGLIGRNKETVTLFITSENKHLNNQDYPYLKSIIETCKKELNVKDDIHLIINPGEEMFIRKSGKKIYLIIGIEDLNILSEEELKNALYHEFNHIYNKDAEISYQIVKRTRVFDELQEVYSSCGLVSLLFKKKCVTLFEERDLFLYFIQLEREKKADEIIINIGNKQTYINALAKTILPIYQDDYRFKMNIYKEGNPPEDFISYYISKREANYLEKKEMYDKLLYSTLLKQFDTHPTLRMRMDALNVEHFDITFHIDNSSEYQEEINKINKAYNNDWYEKVKVSWEKDRQDNYLFYVNEYEQITKKDQNTLTLEDRLKEAYCLMVIGNQDKAQCLYEELLVKYPNNYFVLSNLAFIKYGINDYSCIELFEKAGKINPNFLEESSFFIGLYLNNNGLEEEMNEYRKEHIDKMKTLISDEKYRKKNKLNVYINSDLSEEKMNVISNEINKYPEIKKAYVIKHMINYDKYQYFLGIIFNKKEKDEIKIKILDDLQIFTSTISDYQLSRFDFTYNIYMKHVIKKRKICNIINKSDI